MRLRAFPILLLLCVSAPCSESGVGFLSINWTGTEALRAGDYPSALKQILVESPVSDSIYRDFKLGVIYFRLGNYSTALDLLQRLVERQPAIAQVAYAYIAEIENALKRTGNALAAYRSVLRGDISQRYRHYIFEKMRGLIEADSTFDMEQAPWLEEYYRYLAPKEELPQPTIADTIEQFIKVGKWLQVDSIVAGTTPWGKESCRIVKSIRTALDSQSLSSKSLLRCAASARTCGELTVAQQFIDEAAKKTAAVVDSAPAERMTSFSAQLAYDMQDWNDAIKKFKKYLIHYGPDPEAYLSVARAYRNLGKEDEAARWYDKLMAAYPRHPKMAEFLWLRAWYHEDAKRFDKAAEYYRKIYTKYPKCSRAEESYIRQALCMYKRKLFDSARIVLDGFVNKFPVSSYVLAGYFWQAKSYLAMRQPDEAMTILRLVSRKEPFDYYAHRSRALLDEFNDTSGVLIDTICGESCMLQWFDSVSIASPEKKTLESYDSSALLSGIFLASIGDLEKAEFFLEPLELDFPGNLTLQYKLALLYVQVGASAEAFRIARRMTWRIPPEFRSEMPLEVYKLFYPTFYAAPIMKEAKKYNVDPFFISGLIRQESIFDPAIVSPAGAVGLMQIMPYTGKYIAEKRGAAFAADSLFKPYYNINFGVFYVYELLKDFDNDYVLTLSAYNAGPHNAKKWAKQNKGEELDLFIEDIGFTETRNYVKRVMANYWSYRFLSSNTPYAYSLEHMGKRK